MSVIERSIRVHWRLRVFFTENVFAPDHPVLRDALAQALPELEQQIEKYFSAPVAGLKLVCPPLFVCGGETAKNSPAIIGGLRGRQK